MKSKLFFIIFLSQFVFSCGTDSTISEGLNSNSKTTYNNLVIISDLSSRIDNKPLKDSIIIRNIIKYFIDECVMPGIKVGDKSSISFTTFSNSEIFSIDLEKFKKLNEKQQFVNSTGKFQSKGLEFQLDVLKNNINDSYGKTRSNGLDLISILIEKISNDELIKKVKNLDIENLSSPNFSNHIYILTDGYLEFSGNNKQFYFGEAEIDKIRKFCTFKSVNIEEALNLNPNLGLPDFKKEIYSNIDLHVYETHERDKNDRLQTYKYPLGLRDNEILEAVWRNWAKRSGFRSFEWKKY